MQKIHARVLAGVIWSCKIKDFDSSSNFCFDVRSSNSNFREWKTIGQRTSVWSKSAIFFLSLTVLFYIESFDSSFTSRQQTSNMRSVNINASTHGVRHLLIEMMMMNLAIVSKQKPLTSSIGGGNSKRLILNSYRNPVRLTIYHERPCAISPHQMKANWIHH